MQGEREIETTMISRAFSAGILTAILAGSILSGCGGGDSSLASLDPTVGSPRRSGDLELNLTTTKRAFGLREIFPLTLSVKNLGQTAVTFDTGNPHQINWEMSLNGQVKVSGPAGASSTSSFTLSPGEQRQFSLDVALTSVDSAGDYDITAWIDAYSVIPRPANWTSAKSTLSATPITVTMQ